jgi:hypothetical protein
MLTILLAIVSYSIMILFTRARNPDVVREKPTTVLELCPKLVWLDKIETKNKPVRYIERDILPKHG